MVMSYLHISFLIMYQWEFSHWNTRKMINMDEMHFVSAKKKSQINIKAQIDSLICSTRSAGTKVDQLLKEMNLKLSFTKSMILSSLFQH